MSKRCITVLILTGLLTAGGSVYAQDKWESDPLDVLEQAPEIDDENAPPKQGNFQEIETSEEAKLFTDPSVSESTTKVLPAEEVPAADELMNISQPEVAEPAPVVEAEKPMPAELETPVVSKKSSKVKKKSKHSATPRSPDEPDVNRENRYHRVYSKYNTSPTPVESWDAAVASRPSKSYLIQKNDTLSGVSEMLFGDPHYWPKIWSQNSSSILNPHIIDPGLNVNFYPGSQEDIPTLDVRLADGADVIETVAEQRLIDESGVERVETQKIRVQIPPTKRKIAPLMEKLPPSLPRALTLADQQKEPGISLDVKAHRIPSATEYLGYYVQNERLTGAGVVKSVELDLPSAGENQYIYVTLDEGGLGTYVAQKNMPDVKNRNGGNAKLIEVQGEIQVLEVVNSNKNIYRAIVTKSISPVEVGAVLSPGKMQMVDIGSNGSSGDVAAEIIGGQFSEERSIIGANSYVFINAGREQGVSEGMTLSVFEDADKKTLTSQAHENDREIARMKIVKVSESFSTGYVLWAVEEINVGDMVGRRQGGSAVSNLQKSDSLDEEFRADDSSDFKDEAPAIDYTEPGTVDEFDSF